MVVIVGLGNPGEKYKNNRHNVGFQFIEYLKKQTQNSKFKIQNHNLKLKTKKDLLFIIYPLSSNLILVKPQTFMNNSGLAVKKLIKNLKLKIKNLIVVHDDLDIPLGKFKIQKGVGPKLHHGLNSIENHLKTKDFWRVRIGLDNRLENQKNGVARRRIVSGEAYVLEDFSEKEKKTIFQLFPTILFHLRGVIGVGKLL